MYLLAEELRVLEKDGRENKVYKEDGEEPGKVGTLYFRSILEYSYNLSYELKPLF